jgi:hypothetical protein
LERDKGLESSTFQAHDSGAEQRNEEFDNMLLSSILRVSLGVFGQNTAEIVLSYMEYLSGLKREDIAARTELFKELLGEVLGCGATVVERLIVKDLYSRLGLGMPEIDDFLMAINRARNLYVRLNESKLEVLSSQKIMR